MVNATELLNPLISLAEFTARTQIWYVPLASRSGIRKEAIDSSAFRSKLRTLYDLVESVLSCFTNN